ncbi:hypothetical protein MYX82_04935 [Acidobacteria bacterium AH-259-D05]|nr:hypothetical protein [Acidobacteria bacterium AH-259-D05]
MNNKHLTLMVILSLLSGLVAGAISTFLLMPQSVSAQDSSQEVQDALYLLASESRLGGKVRHQAAISLLERMKKIDDAIPTLSSSQREWLKKAEQEASTSADRLANFVNSTEYTLERVKSGSSQLVIALEQIVETRVPDLELEVLLWSIVSYHLSDEIFWDYLQTLMDSGVVSESAELLGSSVGDILYRGWGRDIHEKIVMPFLNGTLPK